MMAKRAVVKAEQGNQMHDERMQNALFEVLSVYCNPRMKDRRL